MTLEELIEQTHLSVKLNLDRNECIIESIFIGKAAALGAVKTLAKKMYEIAHIAPLIRFTYIINRNTLVQTYRYAVIDKNGHLSLDFCIKGYIRDHEEIESLAAEIRKLIPLINEN